MQTSDDQRREIAKPYPRLCERSETATRFVNEAKGVNRV
jgi:hypothetical protein